MFTAPRELREWTRIQLQPAVFFGLTNKARLFFSKTANASGVSCIVVWS